MPSPIGHALAGAAIAWSLGGASTTGASTRWRLPIVCAVCAALPDIDLLYMPTHRTATHSVPVAVLLTILAVVVTGWVNPIRDWAGRRFGVRLADVRHRPRLRSRLVVAHPAGLARRRRQSAPRRPGTLAVQRHVVLSGVDVFPGTQRRNPLSMSAMLINLQAAIWETALMGSIAAAVWWLRSRLS